MKERPIYRTLIDVGLSDKEASVYLASLTLGPEKITAIAKLAEVKRPTAYGIIESLTAKGLISVEVSGFKNKYVATNPERLEAIIDAKKVALRESLSELTALYNLKGGSSSIRCYSAFEGIKSTYESVLKQIKPTDYYLAIADQEQWMNLDKNYFEDYKQRRAKLNVPTRLLLIDNKTSQRNKKLEANYHEEVRFLPSTTTLTTNLVITPWAVIIHQLVPPVTAIVIENRSVVQMNKEYFEIMWKAMV